MNEQARLLIQDFYAKYDPDRYSEEQVDKVIDFYGDNTDLLIKDFYAKYDPDRYSEEQVESVKGFYFSDKKKDETPQEAPQEEVQKADTVSVQQSLDEPLPSTPQAVGESSSEEDSMDGIETTGTGESLSYSENLAALAEANRESAPPSGTSLNQMSVELATKMFNTFVNDLPAEVMGAKANRSIKEINRIENVITGKNPEDKVNYQIDVMGEKIDSFYTVKELSEKKAKLIAEISEQIVDIKELRDVSAKFQDEEYSLLDGVNPIEVAGLIGSQIPRLTTSVVAPYIGSFVQMNGALAYDVIKETTAKEIGKKIEDVSPEDMISVIDKGAVDAQLVDVASAGMASLDLIGLGLLSAPIKTIGKQALKHVVKGSIKKKAGKSAVASIAKSFGKKLTAPLGEFTTESTQNIIEQYTGATAGGREFDLDWANMLEEGVAGGLIGLLTMGAGSGRAPQSRLQQIIDDGDHEILRQAVEEGRIMLDDFSEQQRETIGIGEFEGKQKENGEQSGDRTGSDVQQGAAESDQSSEVDGGTEPISEGDGQEAGIGATQSDDIQTEQVKFKSSQKEKGKYELLESGKYKAEIEKDNNGNWDLTISETDGEKTTIIETDVFKTKKETVAALKEWESLTNEKQAEVQTAQEAEVIEIQETQEVEKKSQEVSESDAIVSKFLSTPESLTDEEAAMLDSILEDMDDKEQTKAAVSSVEASVDENTTIPQEKKSTEEESKSASISSLLPTIAGLRRKRKGKGLTKAEQKKLESLESQLKDLQSKLSKKDGIRTELQGSEKLGELDGATGREDERTEAGDKATKNGKSKTGKSDGKGTKTAISQSKLEKAELNSDELKFVKGATKTKPEVRGILVDGEVRLVQTDRKTDQFVEIDKITGEIIGNPLGKSQNEAKHTLRGREGKPDPLNDYALSETEKEALSFAEQITEEETQEDVNDEAPKMGGRSLEGVINWADTMFANERALAERYVEGLGKRFPEIKALGKKLSIEFHTLASRVARAVTRIKETELNPAYKGGFINGLLSDNMSIEQFEEIAVARHIPEANKALISEKTKKLNTLRDELAELKKKEEEIVGERRPPKEGGQPKKITLSPEETTELKSIGAKIRNRNKKIKEAAKDLTTRGVGMTNEQAKAILDKYTPEQIETYEKHEKVFRDKFVSKILDEKYRNNLLTEKEYNDSRKFEFYISRKIAEAQSTKANIGRTTAVKRGLFKRLGSNKDNSLRVNPIAQAISDYAEAIESIEKNKFLLNLKEISEITGSKQIQVVKPMYKQGIDKTPDKIKNNSQKVYLNKGKYVYIHIQDDELKKSFFESSNFGHKIYGQPAVRWAAKTLRNLNTTYNPAFVPINAIMDFQTALSNIGSELDLNNGDRFIMAKYTMGGYKALWKAIKSNNFEGEIGKLVKQYQDLGGASTWSSPQDVVKILEKIKSDMKKGKVNPSIPDSVANFTRNLNDVVEQGVRFAAFRLALDKGKTAQEAAYIAKNLTVNFERKGRAGSLMNTVFLFSNAAIQSNIRMVRTMRKNPALAIKIASAHMLVGFISGMISDLMGDDEEMPNDYEIERNAVFQIFDMFIKIPLAYGFGVFASLGRHMYEMMKFVDSEGARGEDPARALAAISKSVVATANPMHSATILQFLSPTLTDALAQNYENKTFAGTDIARVMGYNLDPVKARNGKDSTAKFWHQLATGIQEFTGADMEPEKYRNLFRFYTGGIGRFVMRGIEVGQKAIDSEQEVRIGDIAILRRIIRGSSEYYAMSEVYRKSDNAKKRLFTENEWNSLTDHLSEMVEKKTISKKSARGLYKGIYMDQQAVALQKQHNIKSFSEAKEIIRKRNK